MTQTSMVKISRVRMPTMVSSKPMAAVVAVVVVAVPHLVAQDKLFQMIQQVAQLHPKDTRNETNNEQ